MITASIVTYKTPLDELKNIIQCIDHSCITSLFIIDNSPTNKLQEHICSLSKKIMYFWGHGNIGYGSAHNIALKKVLQENAKYHIVMNSDIDFNPEIIKIINDYMDQNTDTSLLMPKVFYPNGEIQYLCKLCPTPFDLFSRRFLPRNTITMKIENRFVLLHSGYNRIMNPPCLSGCFMFVRMATVEANNLFFDDRFFMYFEDFDLVRRFHRISKTIFFPAVSIIHNHARQSHTSKRMLFVFINSLIKYFNKYGWFIDRERRKMNAKILLEITELIAMAQI